MTFLPSRFRAAFISKPSVNPRNLPHLGLAKLPFYQDHQIPLNFSWQLYFSKVSCHEYDV